MKKNLPNDNLEKFLQKALEHYEENPSEGLWAKIEAELPAAAPLASTGTYGLLRIWALRAAAALFIGFSLFTFFHYQNQLDNLAEELNCTRSELQEWKDYAAKKPQPQEAIPFEYLPATGQPIPLYDMAEKGYPIAEELLEIPALEVLTAAETPQSIRSIEGLAAHFNFLEGKIPQFSIKYPTIKPSKNTTKWSVGIQSGLAQTTFSKQPSPKPGPGHHEPLRTFDGGADTKTASSVFGIGVSYELGKNWSLETGLQYRRFDSETTHRPDLKFGDRKGHGGGPHPHDEHDFEYYLNTPSGTVFVSLSADQADPQENIPNQEELKVEISTKDRFEYLSIPLTLGYQIGRGRLTGQLRAGLMANIGLAKEFTVNDVCFENDKFKPHGGKGVQVEAPAFNPLSFDYVLGAGAAYDLSPSWRISLMPSLTGSLTKKFDAIFTDPSDYSLGVNAALSYRF